MRKFGTSGAGCGSSARSLRSPTLTGGSDRLRAVGANVRLLRGPLDAGVGAVTRHDADPWGTGAAIEMRSVFGKGEYFVWPWLAASMKVERFSARSSAAHAAARSGHPHPEHRATRRGALSTIDLTDSPATTRLSTLGRPAVGFVPSRLHLRNRFNSHDRSSLCSILSTELRV